MNSYVLSAIILSALITFLLRAFPFLLFKEKELPKWLEKLEKHLPMTIMAVLIVYCLKDLKMQLTTLFIPYPVRKSSAYLFIPYLLACLTVVFTYKWKKNTFLSIILSTLVYMIFIRL